ncbi:uncharacterized protein LOC115625278 [Scaptodrosophila lebanonensis]|uniref:Uncharacterized protein LOC115625278 n=1 Tax=Drosophila lebanonensis TaxID=7225 RepID=A0A6J2TM99_DROLE|nr:uncharacterized protein LOC115625278 [Scaptodrosophila lebanonensis]
MQHQGKLFCSWKMLSTFVLLLALWGGESRALRFRQPPCPLYGSEEIPEECPYNFHTIESEGCRPRYFCAKREGESCNVYQREDKCMGNLTCVCGVCQNCYEDSCHLELCPNYQKRYATRLPIWYQARWRNMLAE